MFKGINNVYITLVPKVQGIKNFIDFTPSSLVNGIYKIIAKILSSRIKYFIDDLLVIVNRLSF